MAETSAEVLDGVRKIVAAVMRKPIDAINPDSSLIEDFDCVSIDFVDMVFEIEDTFHVDLSKNAYDLLSEIFGENVLASGELLTEFGARVMQARMPDIAPDRIQPGMSIYDMPKLLTPRVWARAIEEVMAARPAKCDSCGSANLDFSDEEIVCKDCDHGMPQPDQEEVVRAWAAPFLSEAPRVEGAPQVA